MIIVILIGGDGASKNRSCFKSLANKTARDILKGHYPADLLEQLNLDFKIAFAHPNPEYAEAIVIFIGADMPHWVKKVRNAMDNKQTRDLSFNGCGLMLERLYGIHKTMNDCEITSRADVRMYKFGEEHFTLNSYNKMRVFLAMHILSQNVIRMIRDF